MSENNKDNEVKTKPVPTSCTENKKSKIDTMPIKSSTTHTYDKENKQLLVLYSTFSNSCIIVYNSFASI